MKEEKNKKEKKCPDCDGKGWITELIQGDPFMKDCEKCGGIGKIAG